MNFLIIGLGSMGKRRGRCLQALGHQKITGYDKRVDRCMESEALYGILAFSKLDEVDFSKIDAFIIATPPDCHLEYINLAIDKGIPAFVEASVILDGLSSANFRALEKGVLIAPSCTLRFHPAIKDIKELVSCNKYGRFNNFSYHSGQYLPDWHPWEDVKDYYVSSKETGGAREIVPFELTWIVDVFSFPLNIKGFYGKTMDVGADIDDSYALSLQFEQGVGTLLVDVVSRYALRSMTINLERGQIIWNWNDGIVKVYEADSDRWINYCSPVGKAAEGYNKNITEQMYIDETRSFLLAVSGKEQFPNTLENDIQVLELLEQAECNNE